MSRTAYALPLVVLVWSLLVAGPAYGQESTTRGFTLGIHASGAALTVENGERNDAGGGGIRAGYGLNRNFTLLVQFDGAQFDVQESDDGIGGDWSMGHVDIGTRFHFANSLRAWVPYLQAAFTARVVEVTNAVAGDTELADIRFNGGAFTVGGGLMAYFTETFALDVQASWSGGEFTEVESGAITVGALDIDAKSSRVSVGVAWWP